jgi:methylamine utilization protein MauE
MSVLALTLAVLVRLAAGGLLTVAGAMKLAGSRYERKSWLASYNVVPARALATVAVVLPASELAGGIAFVVGAFGRLSAALVTLLFLVIITVTAATLLRGRRPDCGCLGSLRSRFISWPLVWRNVLVVAATSLIWLTYPDAPSLSPLPWPIQLGVVALLAVLVGGSLRRVTAQRSVTGPEPVTVK